jgi:hypothetical protein
LVHLGPAVQVHRTPFTTAAGPPHFLHKSDAQHIGADQHGETADGNGEIDPLHGDSRKRPRSKICDSREPLPTRSLLAVPSHDHGSKRSGDVRSHPLVAREVAAEATSGHRSSAAWSLPPSLFQRRRTARSCGPFAARFDADRTVRILASLYDGIYFRRKGRFRIPIWLIAGITGIVERGTFAHRHVVRVSCRSCDTEVGCR